MNISGRTEERLFRENTGLSEDMTVPAAKDHRFGFMIGMFNDGLRLVLKRKELFHYSDESLIKIQRSMFDKYELTFEHSRNILWNNNPYRLTLDYQQTFKYSKFIAYEKAMSLSIRDLMHWKDWDLKFSLESRKNVFDSAA